MAKTRRRPAATKKSSPWIPIAIAAGVVIVLFGALIVFSQQATQAVITTTTVDYPTGITEDGQPYKGGADAAVVIEDFSDFRCSHCRALAQSFKDINADYIKSGQVKVVFKQFPLGSQGSINAAKATECALEQSPDYFWLYHDVLFENQDRGESIYTQSSLKGIAEQLGMDGGQFSRCFSDPATSTKVQQDKSEGDSKGITSTPTMFFNGEVHVGSLSPSALKDLIDKYAATS